MGLFGGQPKLDLHAEPPMPTAEEERFENLPSLPRPSSTVIAEGVTLTGSIQGEGVVQVEGVVEGELSITGSVIVAPTGLVRGPVAADVVRLAGRIEGSVTARNHLRLEHTGRMEGDVATASLVVEDGGRLNGRSTMTKAPKPDSELGGVDPVDDLQFGPDFKVGGDGEA